MKKSTPQTLKGFRDFLPTEKQHRDYVESIIISVFQQFGFAPLETPTLEYASLLTGKYGEEADKLVYTFEDNGGRKVGLRYDQTVPTARVLSQYQQELPKYFRRYQVQNVFRADKPQKGRYREFRQCDIDIFGSTSPLADAEVLACVYQAYAAIGFESIELKINDRKVLMDTLKPYASDSLSVTSIITTIDKLDKIDADGVIKELSSKGLSVDQATEALTKLQSAQPSENLKHILQHATSLGVAESVLQFTPTIARGLDYYTGMIFEVIIPEFTVGSVGGGGRYDNLIENLSGTPMPAVGMAFGFDRTVEAALQLNLVPDDHQQKVMMAQLDEQTIENSLQTAQALRAHGITTEVYPAVDKLSKQFSYADKNGFGWVGMIGEKEAETDKITLKNMKSGDQQELSLEDLISKLSDAKHLS